jgi:predicted CXXCH cytochrome family protein
MGRAMTVTILTFLISLLSVFSSEGLEDVEKKKVGDCLQCHGRPGIIKRFENGETIEAYVDIERLRRSAHKGLRCIDCHSDFSEERHPVGRFRSKEQFKIRMALICRRCHKCEEIKNASIHLNLTKEESGGRPHPCTNCHGSHAVREVSRRTYGNEEQYCLNCHGHPLSLSFRNGETITFRINLSELQTSVHRRLSCSDCHFGFSESQHPRRNFRGRREFSIANSETCRRCHFDKYSNTLESIHYTLLSQGNLNAPVCTDCHGFHSIQRLGKERILIARRCQKCHEGIYSIYANSVHGKALIDENNQDVPVCIDCHTAHNIKDPLTLDYREHIPDLCSNCHSNKAIMSKYGLSTDVVKTYLQSFHGVTLNLYRKQREEFGKPARLIAVCTDCHGTHNIISTRTIEPAFLKANLIKRCQQCHKDAPPRFSDSWISHYKPSLSKAPLIFLIEWIYNIFTPILIGGILLQIFLHVWRYAVNR